MDRRTTLGLGHTHCIRTLAAVMVLPDAPSEQEGVHTLHRVLADMAAADHVDY